MTTSIDPYSGSSMNSNMGQQGYDAPDPSIRSISNTRTGSNRPDQYMPPTGAPSPVEASSRSLTATLIELITRQDQGGQGASAYKVAEGAMPYLDPSKQNRESVEVLAGLIEEKIGKEFIGPSMGNVSKIAGLIYDIQEQTFDASMRPEIKPQIDSGVSGGYDDVGLSEDNFNPAWNKVISDRPEYGEAIKPSLSPDLDGARAKIKKLYEDIESQYKIPTPEMIDPSDHVAVKSHIKKSLARSLNKEGFLRDIVKKGYGPIVEEILEEMPIDFGIEIEALMEGLKSGATLGIYDSKIPLQAGDVDVFGLSVSPSAVTGEIVGALPWEVAGGIGGYAAGGRVLNKIAKSNPTLRNMKKKSAAARKNIDRNLKDVDEEILERVGKKELNRQKKSGYIDVDPDIKSWDKASRISGHIGAAFSMGGLGFISSVIKDDDDISKALTIGAGWAAAEIISPFLFKMVGRAFRAVRKGDKLTPDQISALKEFQEKLKSAQDPTSPEHKVATTAVDSEQTISNANSDEVKSADPVSAPVSAVETSVPVESVKTSSSPVMVAMKDAVKSISKKEVTPEQSSYYTDVKESFKHSSGEVNPNTRAVQVRDRLSDVHREIFKGIYDSDSSIKIRAIVSKSFEDGDIDDTTAEALLKDIYGGKIDGDEWLKSYETQLKTRNEAARIVNAGESVDSVAEKYLVSQEILLQQGVAYSDEATEGTMAAAMRKAVVDADFKNRQAIIIRDLRAKKDLLEDKLERAELEEVEGIVSELQRLDQEILLQEGSPYSNEALEQLVSGKGRGGSAGAQATGEPATEEQLDEIYSLMAEIKRTGGHFREETSKLGLPEKVRREEVFYTKQGADKTIQELKKMFFQVEGIIFERQHMSSYLAEFKGKRKDYLYRKNKTLGKRIKQNTKLEQVDEWTYDNKGDNSPLLPFTPGSSRRGMKNDRDFVKLYAQAEGMFDFVRAKRSEITLGLNKHLSKIFPNLPQAKESSGGTGMWDKMKGTFPESERTTLKTNIGAMFGNTESRDVLALAKKNSTLLYRLLNQDTVYGNASEGVVASILKENPHLEQPYHAAREVIDRLARESNLPEGMPFDDYFGELFQGDSGAARMRRYLDTFPNYKPVMDKMEDIKLDMEVKLNGLYDDISKRPEPTKEQNEAIDRLEESIARMQDIVDDPRRAATRDIRVNDDKSRRISKQRNRDEGIKYDTNFRDVNIALNSYITMMTEMAPMNRFIRSTNFTLDMTPDILNNGAKNKKKSYIEKWSRNIIGQPTDFRALAADFYRDRHMMHKGMDWLIENIGGAQEKGILELARKGRLDTREFISELDPTSGKTTKVKNPRYNTMQGYEPGDEAKALDFFNELTERADAFTAEGKYKGMSMDKTRASLALQIQEIRTALSNPNKRDPIIGAIYDWMIFAKLGFNIMHGVTNLTQTITNTYPTLGWNYTKRGFEGYLNDNQTIEDLLNVSDTKNPDIKLSPEDLRLSMAEVAERSGIKKDAYDDIDHTYSHSDPSVLGAIASVPMRPAAISEDFNRGVGFAGRLLKEIEEGAPSLDEAIIRAKTYVRDTQFSFSRQNTIPVFQGQVARLLFMFKSFAIHQTHFSADLFLDAIRNDELKNIFFGKSKGGDTSRMEAAKKSALMRQIFAYLGLWGAGATVFKWTNLKYGTTPPALDMLDNAFGDNEEFYTERPLSNTFFGPFGQGVINAIASSVQGESPLDDIYRTALPVFPKRIKDGDPTGILNRSTKDKIYGND